MGYIVKAPVIEALDNDDLTLVPDEARRSQQQRIALRKVQPARPARLQRCNVAATLGCEL